MGNKIMILNGYRNEILIWNPDTEDGVDSRYHQEQAIKFTFLVGASKSMTYSFKLSIGMGYSSTLLLIQLLQNRDLNM